MEIASSAAAHPLTFYSSSSCCGCTSSVAAAAAPLSQLRLRSSVAAATRRSVHLQCSFSPVRGAKVSGIGQRKVLGSVRASSSEAASTSVAESWLLQPVGDGDFRHIGFKVERPGAFEIASAEVTVGRLPEKADMVIPVATVSGVHARLQKKGGDLLVTDLDSTNGTFINEKRLRPGVAATAFPGSRITFGDTHLAIFLVSKLKAVETPVDPTESKDESENEGSEQVLSTQSEGA